MLTLSDLSWTITQEPDATLYAGPAWSFLIHYTRIRHYAVCWPCPIFSDPLHKNPTPRCMLTLSDFSDPFQKNPTLCYMLTLSDLFWSITQESYTTMYADPVWSFLIHYTKTPHHDVCRSYLIFSDLLHKNLTPLCMLILSDLFWSIREKPDTTVYADTVWSFLIH